MSNLNGVKAESPIEAAKQLVKHQVNQGYAVSKVYEYKDASCAVVYWRVRLENQNGDKLIRPIHLGKDDLYYLSEPAFKNNFKPLYCMEFLSHHPLAQVWVVEGEKCVDALNSFFKQHHCLDKYISITSGSATSAQSSDWSLLHNRPIVIFPDNDEEGNKYASSVAQILNSQDCKVEILNIAALGLPEKGDVVDWLEINQHAIIEDLLAIPKTLQVAFPNADVHEESTDMLIKRLATLSPLDYERVRVEEAERLCVRVAVLDREVKKYTSSKDSSSQDFSPFLDIEPWEDEVSAHEVLSALEAVIRQFAVLPEYAYRVLPLWITFTWCIDAAYTAPILALCSPEKRCGKTTMISILSLLTKRPLPTSNITPASLYRSIEAFNPTLLIDEADTFLSKSDELRGILNSGHTRRSAFVIRTVGDDHRPIRFNTFGAKAIAMIGKLPETLEDRSVVIKMRRKLKHEKVQKLERYHDEGFEILQRKLARFANDHIESLKLIRPEALPAKSDRMADNFEPLLAIAELAGQEWLEKAKKALLAIAGEVLDEASIASSLLMDIREAFQIHGPKLFSEKIMTHLTQDKEKRWATYNNGKPITQRQIANILKNFDIHSYTIRIGHETLKGYEHRQFTDAFERYLPPIPDTNVTTSQMNGDTIASVSDSEEDNISFSANVTPDSTQDLDCDVVTDKEDVIDDNRHR